MLSLKKIEQSLLQLTIFLIPTNLAYHWYIDAGYINGRLVDYLLPKLYLSDLPILLLICIDIIRRIKKKNTIRLSSFPILLFIGYLFINALFSGSPLSSVWFVAKFVEFLLFGVYLVHSYTKNNFLKVIYIPLFCAIIFQSSLSLYQYINHKSLIGYTFLGEPNLKSVGISQTNLLGQLEVAPYGTTSHPNVLAGFLFISMVFWLLSAHLSPTSKHGKVLSAILISLSLAIIIVSGSLSALSGVIFLLILILLRKILSRRVYSVIVLMCICGTLLLSVPFIGSLYHSHDLADNHSIAARYELNQVAFSLINRSPLTGIGPNGFTNFVPKTTFSGQRTLFIQPVHHVGLLIWSETGLLGVILLSWCLYRYILHLRHQKGRNDATQDIVLFPLIGLILISSWDHYPLTLQTGQLLTTLSLVLPLLPRLHRG